MESIENLTVLVVEPSLTQYKIIDSHLRSLGVSMVERIKDGQSALAGMRQSHPDLVISAMYLPDMTGTDLVYAMRDDPVLAEIAFILISSETKVRYLEPIRQAGALAILPKPFATANLKKALFTTLDFLFPDEAFSAQYMPEEMRVLIVDDSVTSRHYIRKVLSNLGIQHFAEAENGKLAIELMQTQYFDIIVTDYNMPEMDGDEFVRYVRNESSQASVPILMVTSVSDSNRLASVQQAGISAICDKPFDPQSVKDILAKILSS